MYEGGEKEYRQAGKSVSFDIDQLRADSLARMQRLKSVETRQRPKQTRKVLVTKAQRLKALQLVLTAT